MTSSLVGSEMCIRDSPGRNQGFDPSKKVDITWLDGKPDLKTDIEKDKSEPVSYTHLTLPTICSV
eukprot:774784-Prorocentrum_lima.AAC.1